MTGQVQAFSRTNEAMRRIFESQKHAFRQYFPLGYNKRVEALELLLQSILRSEDLLVNAVKADFGQRSSYETRLLEILPLIDEIRYIGAWNYPILLTLSPLVGALAAGNHAIIKPSELAPVTANAICQLIGETFPSEYVAVITGDSEVSSVFSSLPFDHLIFTGSGRVGRLVMKAAAQNLTPVTLELGGKSPALIHKSYPMAVAADRICSAKFWNAGQTCVAPDYVLVPSGKAEEFVVHSERVIVKRFSGSIFSGDYTHMINSSAWCRMQSLVEDARRKGAQIIQPGSAEAVFTEENCVFPPTLIVGVKDSMRVMQEEIFGPVLPVNTYSSLEEALVFVNNRPRPLALYYFDRDRLRIKRVLEQSVSGGVTINDCIFHLPQHALPFGGVGPSGMGAYHGFDGFTTFSKKKGVLFQNEFVGSVFSRFFKPPYAYWSDCIITFLMGRSARRERRKMILGQNKNSEG
jgi:coniferyl-aldehyde dehydrogenase